MPCAYLLKANRQSIENLRTTMEAEHVKKTGEKRKTCCGSNHG